ncbi:hypothetical protein [Cellulomonas sp.]|uniref:hypothetical protein n=1 Tax=Cellulomonas sp. TaxID=40001 RepID=UPI003BA87CB3
MSLFELTASRTLNAVPATNFAAEGVLERADLQAALRDNIRVIGSDLLVVAEEFGQFQDVKRRIDLLAVDASGQLVVLELKRTDDGGHMELQALRYAAMVSTMTFDQLSDTYERHLQAVSPSDAPHARARLADFLVDAGGEDAVLERRVRIILVSAGFDTQITTTVLWLNDLYQLDITCIRLTPYRVDGRLLLDLQQVIPLPEAQELMVRLRERETAARVASARSDGADWTKYVVAMPGGETDPLRKRRAILAMVSGLAAAGVAPLVIQAAIPGPRFLAVDGELAGPELFEAFVQAHPGAQGNERRWFVEAPVYADGRTWVLSKMWGTNTEPTLRALAELAPGFGYRAASDED